MELETPARILVFGAGPMGLEAALYARYLGYRVDVFEQGRVADNVLRWAHVRMFSPFADSASPLGLAALAAQDPEYRAPPPESLLTGQEFAGRYLRPLAETDLLVDSLHTRTRVLQVVREPLEPAVGEAAERGQWPFRVQVEDDRGQPQWFDGDAILDATGTLNQPRWCGPSDMPVPGERPLNDLIDRYIPDVLGARRQDFANRHTLVVGSGHSAATTVVLLDQLAHTAPQTQVTWITRSERAAPVPVIPADPLPERRRWPKRPTVWHSRRQDVVRHWPRSVMEGMRQDEQGRFRVQLTGDHAGELVVDRLVANVGYRANRAIHADLFDAARRGPRRRRRRADAADGSAVTSDPLPQAAPACERPTPVMHRVLTRRAALLLSGQPVRWRRRPRFC